jgi:hypothetical protein
MVHRLRALLNRADSPRQATLPVAFVPCPGVILQGYSPAQLQQVQDLYRLAREQAEASQGFDQEPAYLPRFSRN